MSLNNSLESNSCGCGTAVNESGTIRKKLRMLKKEPNLSLPEMVLEVINEAIREFKNNEYEIDYLRRDVERLGQKKTLCEDDPNFLKGKIAQLEEENAKLSIKADENMTVAQDERRLREQCEIELNRLRALMTFPKFIEKLERRFFPPWLLNCNYLSRRMKWLLALNMRPTTELLALVKRISSAGLQIKDIAATISKAYGDISDNVMHSEKDVPFISEAELDIVCAELKLSRDERRALDCVFLPVEYQDRKPFIKQQKVSGYLLIELKFDEDLDGPNRVRNVFDQATRGIEKSVILTDNQERNGRIAFVYYRITSADTRDYLETILTKEKEIGKLSAATKDPKIPNLESYRIGLWDE